MTLRDRLARRRLLRGYAPLTASSPEGARVHVTGTVRDLGEPVIAPLSGRECVLVRSRVRLTFHDELILATPFVIELDAGGYVIIDGIHVSIVAPPVKLPRANGQREMAFAARIGKTARQLLQFREQIIVRGQRVTVRGVVVFEPFGSPTDELAFRDTTKPTIRLVGSKRYPLAVIAE